MNTKYICNVKVSIKSENLRQKGIKILTIQEKFNGILKNNIH